MHTLPTPQSLGLRIREARVTADLSPEQLAGGVGRSRDTIERWERGKTVPSYLELVQIAALTQRAVDWFAEGIAA